MNILAILSACIFGWFAQHNTLPLQVEYQEAKQPGVQFADPGDGFIAHTSCDKMGNEFVVYIVSQGKARRLEMKSADCTQGDHAEVARSRTFDGLPYLGDLGIETYDALALTKMRPVKALVCEGKES